MNNIQEIVAKSWARLIKAGRRNIDEVPEELKELVSTLIAQ